MNYIKIDEFYIHVPDYIPNIGKLSQTNINWPIIPSDYTGTCGDFMRINRILNSASQKFTNKCEEPEQ